MEKYEKSIQYFEYLVSVSNTMNQQNICFDPDCQSYHNFSYWLQIFND